MGATWQWATSGKAGAGFPLPPRPRPVNQVKGNGMPDMIEGARGTVGFERKITLRPSHGDYGTDHQVASIFVQFDLADDAATTDANIRAAYLTAKEHVYEQLGVDVWLDTAPNGDMVVREGDPTVHAVAALTAAFGPETAVVQPAPAPPQPTAPQPTAPQVQYVQPPDVTAPAPQAVPPTGATPYGQVIKPSAPIPSWLNDQFNYQLSQGAVEAGEDLWDNRPGLPQFGGSRSPKSPWFKGAKSGGGIWPPKGVTA